MMHPKPRRARRPVRDYLKRFFTSWVKEDPDVGYSKLDEADGLGQVPDPVVKPGA
jgi:hypothetical protein